MKIVWPPPKWGNSPLWKLKLPDFFLIFTVFQIVDSKFLFSKFGDIEKHAILLGIKIIQVIRVISYLS